jgi:hypothetical protein
VVINGKIIRREQLVLITNVTTNTIIYNFADSSLTAGTYTNSTTNNVETTTIVLAYNCSGMSGSDRLSIIVDENDQSFTPSEALMDPVGKLRTSEPQSLIDTDFEYGVQSTKWETLALVNNRPAAFYDPTQGISNVATVLTIGGSISSYQITAITGGAGRVITVTINNTTNITTSTPIFVQDTIDPAANGWYLPATVSANVSFTYIARGTVATSNIFDPTKTYIFVGAFYTQAAIPISASPGAAFTNVGTAVTCVTTNHHGLTAGQAIYVVGTTAATSNPPNGTWQVRQTPNSNTFIFDVITAPVGAITATAGAQLTLFPRTWGTSIHRAFDGGVTFTDGYPYQGNQIIRQTRRFFRYQSGKGVQFSTGSNFCSPWQVDSLTASGRVVTVTTKFPHNIGTGSIIRVSGSDQSFYNGDFLVETAPTDLTFTYTATDNPQASPATSLNGITTQPYQWTGAQIRVGMFTSQNGFFFQYDGSTLSVVRRSSTTQLQGYITGLVNGAQACTGLNTAWAQQLRVNDFIVIRGMSYKVVSIQSNTAMTIYPDYRGTTIASPSQVAVSKTIDLVIPQSAWNIDKADGTGASRFNIDITKMQMWYMDYSWYGAGAIRWGFKNQRGEVIYCHRLAHANVVTEAYMRSGNLPARYEVNTFYPVANVTANIGSGATSISVDSTVGFANTGTIVVTASGNTGAAIEYMNYSGKTLTSFTGLTRGVQNLIGPGGLTSAGGAAATAFNLANVTATLPFGTAPVGVTWWGPQSANTISHWGSSVIMDGRYDDDKSLIFVAGMTATIATLATNVVQPLISIRPAPSVDSGLTGVVGQREVLNTMQLKLQQAGVYSTGTNVSFLITLRLNGNLSGGTFAAAGGSSLSQIAYHTAGQTITGGETIFGFFTTTPGVSSFDLTTVRDLGNSILGGGTTYTVPSGAQNKFPDGPDVVTICAQNVTPVTQNSVNARIAWTEAQA